MNFEDNNISLLTQFTPNSEIQKMMGENDVWKNSFNNQLLNYFPKKSFAIASISLNPMSYYNIIEQEDDFEKIQSEFERETELDLKELFETIKGNVRGSMTVLDNMNFMDTFISTSHAPIEIYEISKAGYLSSEDKELLNQGKTIQAESYSRRYCINIKNIINNGGTVETAIANDSKINWYEGGWDYK